MFPTLIYVTFTHPAEGERIYIQKTVHQGVDREEAAKNPLNVAFVSMRWIVATRISRTEQAAVSERKSQ